MERIKNWMKKDWNETKVLFKCLPAFPFAILCSALIAMNFLANKGIVPEQFTRFFQADAGIIVSWVAFLAGDMLVKRFGAKAAIKVNVAAITVQLFAIILLTLGSLLPWSYTIEPGSYEAVFDSIFRLSLWPLCAGTGAFIIATVCDSFLSKFVLTRFRNRTTFKAYATASYTSTAVGQFIDNLAFALLFSVWQPWFTDFNAIWLFSAAGMVIELICQAVFSPLGYKISKNWAKKGVGDEYIKLVKEAQEVNSTGDSTKKEVVAA